MQMQRKDRVVVSRRRGRFLGVVICLVAAGIFVFFQDAISGAGSDSEEDDTDGQLPGTPRRSAWRGQGFFGPDSVGTRDSSRDLESAIPHSDEEREDPQDILRRAKDAEGDAGAAEGGEGASKGGASGEGASQGGASGEGTSGGGTSGEGASGGGASGEGASGGGAYGRSRAAEIVRQVEDASRQREQEPRTFWGRLKAEAGMPQGEPGKGAGGGSLSQQVKQQQGTQGALRGQSAHSGAGSGGAGGDGSDPLVGRPGFEDAWRDRVKLQGADEQTCAKDLEEADALKFQRDFRESPVRVHNSEVRRWECSVPCEFSLDESKPLDGNLGGGQGRFRVLRSMEAASYYGQNRPEAARQAGFDIIMTVHYTSDVPVQYGSWEEYDIMRPLQPKDPSLGVAAAFISNCAATNFRLAAVEALQRLMQIDSYGRCAHNREESNHDKQDTLMKYKFSLAFENSCEEDYVTEKFWQSIVAGAVPVVIGAPNIADFAPNNNSFLQIRSLDEVPAVAQRMVALHKDEDAWRAMVDWKEKGPSDQFLANMDISTVHSSCRLCIFIADKIRADDATVAKRSRPCRCLNQAAEGGPSHLYHIFVRERFTFEYTSITLGPLELNLVSLMVQIQNKFSSMQHQPIWATKRPKPLATKERIDALRVYRVYPAGLNQKEALQGDKWFQTDEDFFNHLASHPCPFLEVIFI